MTPRPRVLRIITTLGAALAISSCAVVAGLDRYDEGTATAASDAGDEAATDDYVRDDDGDTAIATSDVDSAFAIDTAAPADTACVTSTVPAIKLPVDIIMAVDQSGSMSDDIANVKANINNLSDYLKAAGLDYRLIMIAAPGSTTYSVCVPPPLGGGMCGADNPPAFKQVPQNVQSTDVLARILQTYDGAPGPYQPFLRPTAVKAFVPITDDNSSLAANAFDAELLAKPGGQFGTPARRNYLVFPIMGAPAYPSESPKCGSNAVNTGSQYIALTKLAGGGSKWFPICLKDFGPVFSDMAKSLAAGVTCELGFPKPPAGETFDPEKVNVTYTPSSGGAPTEFVQDASKPCDGGANGWQYNADKSKILLCGSTCAAVRTDPTGVVNVVFGCKTKGSP